MERSGLWKSYGRELKRKEGKKKKKKVWVHVWRRNKEGEKKEKKEGEPTSVERKKKCYHNIFTINLKVSYY